MNTKLFLSPFKKNKNEKPLQSLENKKIKMSDTKIKTIRANIVIMRLFLLYPMQNEHKTFFLLRANMLILVYCANGYLNAYHLFYNMYGKLVNLHNLNTC